MFKKSFFKTYIPATLVGALLIQAVGNALQHHSYANDVSPLDRVQSELDKAADEHSGVVIDKVFSGRVRPSDDVVIVTLPVHRRFLVHPETTSPDRIEGVTLSFGEPEHPSEFHAEVKDGAVKFTATGTFPPAKDLVADITRMATSYAMANGIDDIVHGEHPWMPSNPEFVYYEDQDFADRLVLGLQQPIEPAQPELDEIAAFHKLSDVHRVDAGILSDGPTVKIAFVENATATCIVAAKLTYPDDSVFEIKDLSMIYPYNKTQLVASGYGNFPSSEVGRHQLHEIFSDANFIQVLGKNGASRAAAFDQNLIKGGSCGHPAL